MLGGLPYTWLAGKSPNVVTLYVYIHVLYVMMNTSDVGSELYAYQYMLLHISDLCNTCSYSTVGSAAA